MNGGLIPLPDESLPPKESHRAVGSQLPLYRFKCFGVVVDLTSSNESAIKGND